MIIHPSPFSLAGRRVLITGASGGLGRAIAIQAAASGAEVILNGRDRERCEETLKQLPGSGHRVSAFDLREADVVGWMRKLSADFGQLDGCVHAAGIQKVRPLRILDEKALEETIQINVSSALGLARGFRQRGVCRDGGSIVWIASVMALTGQPGQGAYSASKGALVSMCRSLALELAKERIRLNCIAPGVVQTGMGDALRDTLPSDQFAAVTAMHPLGLGKPEQVAAPAVFLLSEAAAWITGTTLVVDGGYCAH